MSSSVSPVHAGSVLFHAVLGLGSRMLSVVQLAFSAPTLVCSRHSWVPVSGALIVMLRFCLIACVYNYGYLVAPR